MSIALLQAAGPGFALIALVAVLSRRLAPDRDDRGAAAEHHLSKRSRERRRLLQGNSPEQIGSRGGQPCAGDESDLPPTWRSVLTMKNLADLRADSEQINHELQPIMDFERGIHAVASLRMPAGRIATTLI